MALLNKRWSLILLIIGLILLIPFIAMKFTNEVNWTLMDFVIAGGLLLGTGFLCDLTLRKIKTKKQRIAIIVFLLVVLFLIWAELAVGIFGTPFGVS